MPAPLVNVTLPVFNEEAQLAASVGTVRDFLVNHAFNFEIVIANNGSTDRTPRLADELARDLSGVRVVHLLERGRGRALRRVWTDSAADILSYMDIDLSTDLEAFPALIEAVTTGGFDLATGSRLLPQSRTTRSWNREIISRAYNQLVRAAFKTRIADAQCGFKAIRREAARELLPRVADNEWFFDTELLVWAERRGRRIAELPVRWIEDRDSRVKLLPTAWADLQALRRLRRRIGGHSAART